MCMCKWLHIMKNYNFAVLQVAVATTFFPDYDESHNYLFNNDTKPVRISFISSIIFIFVNYTFEYCSFKCNPLPIYLSRNQRYMDMAISCIE